MTIKRLISALLLVIFSVALFASCTPDSIADDTTYDINESVNLNQLKEAPRNG